MLKAIRNTPAALDLADYIQDQLDQLDPDGLVITLLAGAAHTDGLTAILNSQ